MLVMIKVWTVGTPITNDQFMVRFKVTLSPWLIKGMNHWGQVVHEAFVSFHSIKVEDSTILPI
jgi:hypothetical protein